MKARLEALVDAARAQTGLENFGGDSWREGLEVLLRSALSEGRFNAYGEQIFYGSIQQALANRLRIEDWFARHPEIEDEEVRVELLGIGFPRTGSTALSHLLGEDGSVRSLRMWEASAPCPPPGVSPEDDRARITAARATIQALDQVAPRMRSMLPQSATGPMEDHGLMELEFKAGTFAASARLPSYAEWFLHCDMEPTYRYERRVLQLLQWRCPPKVWQLKSPTHTLFLDAFSSVFPEARFVMTHRDPAVVLTSVSDLYCVVAAPSNTTVDPAEMGALNLRQWSVALDRCLAFRAAGRDDRFHDIGFADFQADPIGAIRELYAWLGRELDPATEQRMRAWRAANPRDSGGGPRHTLRDFGLEEKTIDERFGAYRARFGSLLA